MEFTPAETLALKQFIVLMSETRKTEELPQVVEVMLSYLKDKPSDFKFELEIKIDEIYSMIDDEEDCSLIDEKIRETGLSENHYEVLRMRTMIDFLEN